jgi:ribosomal protein L7/L12
MKVVFTKTEALPYTTLGVATALSVHVHSIEVEIKSDTPSNPVPTVATSDFAFNNFSPMPIEAVKYLLVGNYIGAIKEVRTYYGVGLREARDYVDQFPRR